MPRDRFENYSILILVGVLLERRLDGVVRSRFRPKRPLHGAVDSLAYPNRFPNQASFSSYKHLAQWLRLVEK